MSDILLYNAIAASSQALKEAIGEPKGGRQAILSNPDCFTLWPSAVPTLPAETGSLCVYDNATGYFRCGNCCLWTVPAGATKVRFQLWGAGAGSGAGLCCGGAPQGANGAYATVIMDAVPGCQYTLCAGCAHSFQHYCTQCCDVSGCQSFVTGYGLTNFCADGGCSSIVRQMTMLQGSECCRYQGKGMTTSGACICAGTIGTYFCYSNSCASCAPITRVADTDKKGYGTALTGTVYHIPSMYHADCFNTDFYGCYCTTPLITPAGGLSCVCCFGYSSGTCCGASRCGACTGGFCSPGLGGVFTHVMGGSTELYGDWGRTGMVKVSWC